jgi:molybdopterin synthase catalytic subunit
MQVHIRFFAGQRDVVGQTELDLSIPPGTTVDQLWARLTNEYPPLSRYSGHVRCAVNHEFCEPSTVLNAGDEVAYIPPVSGGSMARHGSAVVSSTPAFVITNEPLHAAPLVRLVQTPHDGAVVTFAGVVRNHSEGRPTAYLTYEAYTTMAIPVLARIADEARARYAIGRAAVHHRVGRLWVGETAVLVVVAAPHRQAAFDAASYIMDRIKQDAPIWKKEHWADGGSEWHDIPT